MKKLFYKNFPLIFIFLVWFIFASPYFLKHKVPYSSTYQSNFFPPWSTYHTYDGPVKNAAMPDIIDQIYPWKHFTIEGLWSGYIPLWNPYSFSGTVHLANYQSAVLSLFNLLFLILPFIDAWSMLVLLQSLLAGISMYLFSRSLKISIIGSLISAIGFMFCGFITVWMDYATLAYAILFLPLALFAVEKFYEYSNRLYLVLLSLSFPIAFFNGHFQESLYFTSFILIYISYEALQNKEKKKIVLLYLSAFCGILITFPQILPSIEAYNQSLRSSLFRIEEVIPWNYLPTFIAPDFFGHPVTRNDWFGHYAEWNGYIGLLPFVLSFYILIRKRQKDILFFSCVALVSLLLAFPSPLLSLVVALHIPVLATSAASRIIVIFSFCLLILAGFGFDQLIKDLQDKKYKFIISLLGIFGIILVALWLLVFLKLFMPINRVLIAKQNLIFPSLLFMATCLVIFAVRPWSNTGKNKKAIFLLLSCLLLFMTSFDMLRFAIKWQAFDPKDLVFKDTPLVSFLRKTVKPEERVLGNFGANVCVYYHLSCVDGYDTLYIKRYGEFMSYVATGMPGESFRSVVAFPNIGTYSPQAVNILGIEYIVHKISDGQAVWTFPYWKYPSDQFQLIYNDGAYEVYKNTEAFPRVLLVDNYTVKKDEDILPTMFSSNYNLRKSIVLEQDPHVPVGMSSGTAKIISYRPNEIDISTRVSNEQILLLVDNYYPGWKAFANGKETKIFRTDYTFRSVIIPKGNSIVIFKYQPLSFSLGIWAAIVGIIGEVLIVVLGKTQKVKQIISSKKLSL